MLANATGQAAWPQKHYSVAVRPSLLLVPLILYCSFP